MNTHAVPSWVFPWNTRGGRFSQLFPARREDLYFHVALRVVGGGGTTAPVSRFPRRTGHAGPTLQLPPLGVECRPTTTKAALDLCPRLPPSALDGAGPFEDAPPYAPRRPCLAGPWSPRRGGDTHERNVLACYMRGTCSSWAAQSALYPLREDRTGLRPPLMGLSPPR